MMNNGKKLEKFARKFGTLISSGVPLLKSLNIIIDEINDEMMAKVLKTVAELVKNGKSFSESLEQFPGVFSKSFTGIVKGGESQQRLDEVMIKLADGLKDGSISSGMGEIEDIETVNKDLIVKKLNKIILGAIKENASDIHFIPEQTSVVKIRKGSKLSEFEKYKLEEHKSLIARLKYMSNLDVAETALPQDGRIKIKIENKEYDLRVSILPGVTGEKGTIRIYNHDITNIKPEDVVDDEKSLEKFKEFMNLSHGMIIFSGPVGSGKTTTMLSGVFMNLEKGNVSIATVENPVEYTIPGVAQVQVRENIGLTQIAALRSLMRSDPDIVMVGDIETKETLEMMTKIGLTGHLVLSQFEATNAADVVKKFISMGIEPYLLTSSLRGIVAQRLVRRICPECSKKVKLDENDLKKIDVFSNEKLNFVESTGCDHCNHTGYRGKMVIQEFYKPSTELFDTLINGKFDEIDNIVSRELESTLKGKAINLVKEGKTTLDEIYRVLGDQL